MHIHLCRGVSNHIQSQTTREQTDTIRAVQEHLQANKRFGDLQFAFTAILSDTQERIRLPLQLSPNTTWCNSSAANEAMPI